MWGRRCRKYIILAVMLLFSVMLASLRYSSSNFIYRIQTINKKKLLKQQQQQQPSVANNSDSTVVVKEDDSSTITTTNEEESSLPAVSSEYAYVFLLGSIDLDLPKYKNYMYSIYVSIHLLHQYGSTQDIVVYYGMIDDSPHDDLPQQELNVLRRYPQVRIRKLSKSTSSFYNIILNKFRILGLTQYKRVLFLDADTMPLANLDYYFEYSDPAKHDPPLLHESIIVRGNASPCNAGFFMLAPRAGDLQKVNAIILKKEAKINNGEKFDKLIGWGQRLTEPWYHGMMETPQKCGGKNWNFRAGTGDQGLLYYWVAVVQKKFTVFLADRTGRYENWDVAPLLGSSNSTSSVTKKKTCKDPPPKILPPLYPRSKPNDGTPDPKLYSHWPANKIFPMPDLVHFIGISKPWYVGCKTLTGTGSNKSKSNIKFDSSVSYWCSTLQDVNIKHSLGIDVSSIEDSKKNMHPKVRHNPRQNQGSKIVTLD